MNNKVISISFLVLMFAVTVINLFAPKRDFSENENRYLQDLPSLRLDNILSGKFSYDFETYVSDRFVGRDGWITLKTLSELALLKKDNGRVYFGKDGTLFDATESVDLETLDKNTLLIVDFINMLREKNLELEASVLLIPTASEINGDKLPPFAPVPDQNSAISRVAELTGDSAVVYNAVKLLKSSKDKELYYRTDHHWTSDAAYLVYTGWARKIGLKPLSLEDFSIKSISDSFYGTLFSKANLITLQPDTVKVYSFNDALPVSVDLGDNSTTDSLYFDEYLNKKDKYSYFLGGNRPIMEIKTSTKNGRVLLLLQDSYAHCFVPFLTKHYETICVIDLRYLSINLREYAENAGVTDLLVLYNLPGFAGEKSISKLKER